MTSSIPPQGKHLPPGPASTQSNNDPAGTLQACASFFRYSFLLRSPFLLTTALEGATARSFLFPGGRSCSFHRGCTDSTLMVPTATRITEAARQVLPSCSRSIYSFLFPVSFLILACHGSASNIPCIQLWITAQHLFSIISSLSTYYLSVLTFSSTCHRTSSGTMSSHATSQAPPPQYYLLDDSNHAQDAMKQPEHGVEQDSDHDIEKAPLLDTVGASQLDIENPSSTVVEDIAEVDIEKSTDVHTEDPIPDTWVDKTLHICCWVFFIAITLTWIGIAFFYKSALDDRPTYCVMMSCACYSGRQAISPRRRDTEESPAQYRSDLRFCRILACIDALVMVPFAAWITFAALEWSDPKNSRSV
jgi:hypothetical protein